ncbi:MAG TPA: class I SAM-dependent methyltransferase [Lacipirellulaceae bacterium]|jgi:ABC-2 type transport system ATP-binding protein|nr:class I SAM-dependent methyltransferase [Lacipirellulaceae bacterium]
MNDQLLPNELIDFWSNAAPDYDRVVELQVGHGTRAKVRERLAQEESLGDVVEFGCGSGFFTETLATHATSVLATDLSPGMLSHAEEHLRAPNVTFQIEDCQGSSLEALGFDTAFLSLVLQFADHDRTLAEMRRVLKPGGRLLIANLDVYALSVPHRLRCLFRVIHQGRRGYQVRPPRRFGRNVIGKGKLCELLTRYGFSVLGAESFTNTSRPSYIPVNFIRAEKRSIA